MRVKMSLVWQDLNQIFHEKKSLYLSEDGALYWASGSIAPGDRLAASPLNFRTEDGIEFSLDPQENEWFSIIINL